MNTDTDSLVTFLIAFGVPVSMMVRAYFKMNETDQQSVKSEFTSRNFLLSIGSVALGNFLIEFSDTFSTPSLRLVGFVLLVIGAIGSGIITWKSSKVRSLLIVALFSVLIYFHLS